MDQINSIMNLFYKYTRDFHYNYFLKPLPSKVAIFFHWVNENDFNHFLKVIEFFIERDYKLVNPQDFFNKDGEKKLFISFDDNYIKWYDLAKFLSKKELYVTFYINTLPTLEKSNYNKINNYYLRIKSKSLIQRPLLKHQIIDIHNMGHNIGSHTYSHYNLSSINHKRAKKEILKGKVTLEQLLNKSVLDFSFPLGMKRHLNYNLKKYCYSVGIRTISNAIPGMQYFNFDKNWIYRTIWRLDKSINENIQNIRVNASLYYKLTGRSFLGKY